jgi:hypothetical protein
VGNGEEFAIATWIIIQLIANLAGDKRDEGDKEITPHFHPHSPLPSRTTPNISIDRIYFI